MINFAPFVLNAVECGPITYSLTDEFNLPLSSPCILEASPLQIEVSCAT